VDGSGRSAGFRGTLLIAGALSVVILGNCGGVSTTESPDGANGGTAGDDEPSGGAVTRGGTQTMGGTTGRGGTQTMGGAAGRGGSRPSGGLGGTSAGGPPTGGRGGSSGQSCRLELIDARATCDGGENYAQSPFAEWYAPPGNYELCEAECLARSNCTAVIDYADTYMPRYGCYVYTTPCDRPSTGDWYEEDAGKDYRKTCEDGPCRFEFLGYWLRCENPDSHVRVEGATSIGECEDVCFADPNCTAITDYLWLNEVGGCYLFTGSCVSENGLPYGDEGKTYRKVCGGSGGAGGTGGRGGTGASGGEPDGGVGGEP